MEPVAFAKRHAAPRHAHVAPRHAPVAPTSPRAQADPASLRPRRAHRWLTRLVIVLVAIFAAFMCVLVGFASLQQDRYGDETMSPEGRAIVQACYEVPSPGEDLCAAWVSQVYAKALDRYPTGNANDMYEQLTSTDRSELEPGMAIAVSTHPHTEAGKQYGHIGIYLGEGRVMDNVGHIRVTPLDWWIQHYGANVPVRWGWL